MRQQYQTATSKRSHLPSKRIQHGALFLALLLGIIIFGTARAADFAEGEIYRLQAGETIDDDLYVFAREITIDGTVDGDLIAFGGLIEINGVVTGDLIAAGGGITVNGEVQDDIRAAGAGITIAGVVGDDVIIAGGGGGLPGMPITIGDGSVTPGIRTTQDARIGGDLIVAGDQGDLAGEIGDDLFAAMNSLRFNARVGGDAQLHARTLTVGSTAQVDGTLRYSSADDLVVSSNVATSIVSLPWQEPDATDAPPAGANLAKESGWWLVRTILAALGLALAGWMMLVFMPGAVKNPTAVLAVKPVEAGLIGIAGVALALPTLAALAFLGGLFWGFFPGVAATLPFFFGALGLLWILSPLITGSWLAKKALTASGREMGPLSTMLIGAISILVLARLLALVPCAGQVGAILLLLFSFTLALGSGLMAWLSPRKSPVEEETPSSLHEEVAEETGDEDEKSDEAVGE